MVTRKEFGEKLAACVAAGTLVNFALVAAPAVEAGGRKEKCKTGQDACATGGKGGDSCGNSGGKGQDKCSGKGAKADSCTAPAPDAPVPPCKTDTCSATSEDQPDTPQ